MAAFKTFGELHHQMEAMYPGYQLGEIRIGQQNAYWVILRGGRPVEYVYLGEYQKGPRADKSYSREQLPAVLRG